MMKSQNIYRGGAEAQRTIKGNNENCFFLTYTNNEMPIRHLDSSASSRLRGEKV